ncbi:MAG: hypothetical protein KGJ57_22885 [Sphingomonadales bacterium]|nr:hypothetical protein [Sphingomonadales bacterium]MDE2172232.1 hypothetical protein [Sphingomonadales bacterium]
MILSISKIADRGELEKERIVLKALEDGDIGKFAIFCCRKGKSGSALSGRIPDAYWIIDKQVSQGDLVIIYSKSGTRGEKLNKDGSTSHFFYWGKSESIWSDNRIAAVVNTQAYEFSK